VVTGLTLERVGWLFTETNHDVVMSQRHVKMAAGFQEQFRVTHESGYNISNFVTVVLRPDKDNEAEVKPEVYMISDQGQALHRAGLFVDSGSRSKMKVKEKQKYRIFYLATKTHFPPS
jgi:nuclear protein localization family protein 4